MSKAQKKKYWKNYCWNVKKIIILKNVWIKKIIKISFSIFLFWMISEAKSFQFSENWKGKFKSR